MIEGRIRDILDFLELKMNIICHMTIVPTYARVYPNKQSQIYIHAFVAMDTNRRLRLPVDRRA